MCVKEFLGFICGHCSVPRLRQCPVTALPPIFPPCGIPAEFQIFTNQNCPSCSRAVWNDQVLKQEKIHHGQHERGECECETIFDDAERQRRSKPRPRPTKRNGKGIRDNTSESKFVESAEQIIHGEDGVALSRIATSRNDRVNPYNSEYSLRPQVFNYPPLAYVPAAYAPSFDYASASRYVPPAYPEYNNYQYTGYDTDYYRQSIDMFQVAEGGGFPVNGFAPHSNLWAEQTLVEQAGAEMTWYSGPETFPAIPELPALAVNNAVYQDVFSTQSNWPRAASEPTETTQYPLSPASTIVEAPASSHIPGSFQHESENISEPEPAQPLIVGSSIALPVSPH